uniref:Uncharacterized protein n=2 Tax=Salix viminalis TaxID=40686 RepID=A0A6N2NFH5_SALVM
MVVFLGIKTVMTPPAVSNPSDRGVTSRSSSQSPESSRISTDILLVFPLEFLNKVVHHSVVKILTSKMGISSSGFHLKDTLLDGKKRYIKSTTTQIKNQHILLPNTCCLLVKTISNGSSSGLVDNTHNIQPSNNSSVLCGLSLRVIEVSRDSNHGFTEIMGLSPAPGTTLKDQCLISLCTEESLNLLPIKQEVEKTCFFLVGMVVFLGIKTVMTPAVSRRRDRGVTSERTFSLPSPLKIAAWTAAPYATASSGLMLLQSSFRRKKSCNSCCTLGILVEPPTRTASWTSPFRPFTGSSQSPQSSRISTDILLVFPLKLLNKVVHHSVVKVLASKMGISSSGLHLKDTLLDGKKRDVKSTTTQIKNQHILLPNTCCLLVKTISNGSSSGLVDNTHNIQPGNNSSVLCGLSLRVIEVSRDSNHGVLDSDT